MKILEEHIQSKNDFYVILCHLCCIFLHCAELCPVLFLRKPYCEASAPVDLAATFSRAPVRLVEKNPNEHPFRIFRNRSESEHTERSRCSSLVLSVPLFPTCVLVAVPF